MNKKSELKRHLDQALSEILAARVSLGNLPVDQVLDDAIDAALAESPTVQAARRAFMEALSDIDVSGDAVARQAYLRLEETGNALASVSADTGWRVGLLAARAPTNKPSASSLRR